MVLKVYLPVFTGGTASMGYVASSSVVRDHASLVKVDYGYRGHLRSTKGFPHQWVRLLPQKKEKYEKKN